MKKSRAELSAALAHQREALRIGAAKLRELYKMRSTTAESIFTEVKARIIAETKEAYGDDAQWDDSLAELALFDQADLPN
jgi:hypothetical protein